MKASYKKFFIDVSVFTGTMIILIVMLEIGIRIFFPQPTNYFYFKKVWEPGERFQRWGLEIKINSYGQRDYEYPIDKASNVYRIVILGDSVAFGTGVAIEDTYPKRLETLLNKENQGQQRFEILTFTNGGTEPTGYLEMLRDSASKFNPDLVMVGFTLNDFERPRIKKTSRQVFYDFLTFVHEYMRVRSHVYFLVFERSRSLLYKYKILDKSVRNAFHLAILEARGQDFQDAWQYTQGILKEIRNESTKLGAKFVIVVYPYEMQLSQKLLNIYRNGYGFKLSDRVLDAKPQALLHEFAQTNDISLIDIFEPFKKTVEEGEELYFRELGSSLDWIHPNARGHEVGALAIYHALRCNNSLPLHIVKHLSSEDCAEIEEKNKQ